MDRLRRMEIFVSVVEAGQFTRAAQRLSLSKSTVSKAVSDLESYMGLQLFQRDARSLLLTGDGRSYYEKCLRILSDICVIEDQVRGDTLGMSGPIRLTSTSTHCKKTVMPIIVKFMNLYPDIFIDVVLAERDVDLVAEGADLAFYLGTMTGDSGRLTRKIGSTRLVMCASPAYLDIHGEPQVPADLKDHSCLAYARERVWRFDYKGQEYRFDPKGRVKTNVADNLYDFLLAGFGIGFYPEFWIHDELESGALVRVLKETTGVELDICLVRPANRHCPVRVSGLMKFFQSELKPSKRVT